MLKHVEDRSKHSFDKPRDDCLMSSIFPLKIKVELKQKESASIKRGGGVVLPGH